MLENRTVWILWLQGWDKAGYIQQKVLESWKTNNPDWNINMVTLDTLKDYVTDIDYIYDVNKNITPQAKSDIIRLSLLKNHGGVWADATMLCMQPLDSWVDNAICKNDIWMYHGTGGGMDISIGPASWFILANKDGYIITKWKDACDIYWSRNNNANAYNWMDCLFRELYYNDSKFSEIWQNIPYINCEEFGQSHTLAHNNNMIGSNDNLKDIFRDRPPYALKFWNTWNSAFSSMDNSDCINSNGYYAIEMSKRKKVYKHI